MSVHAVKFRSRSADFGNTLDLARSECHHVFVRMNHTDTHGRVITFRGDAELIAEVDRLARRTGTCSRSAAIRLALAAGLDRLTRERGGAP